MTSKKRATFLTDRFFMSLGACLLVSVAALLFPLLFTLACIALPAVCLITLIDYFSLVKETHFEGSLEIDRTPELGELTSVRFRLRPMTKKRMGPSSFRLIFPLLRTLRFPDRTAAWQRAATAGELETATEALATRLGFERVTSLRALVWSQSRLWFRIVEFSVPETKFRVIPSRRKAAKSAFSEVRSQQRLLYQGNRQKLRGTQADDFYSIRKYQYPDSVRHIDQKKTARYGNLMTRLYETTYDQHLVIGLDLGRSLRGEIAGSAKIDFYVAACLSLAENASLARDRVSFFCFSQRVHHSIRATRNLHSFQPLFEGQEVFNAREEESNYDCLLPTVNQLSGTRSLFILLTDLTRPSVQQALETALPPLCRKHLTVAVSVVDDGRSLSHEIPRLADKRVALADYGRLLHSYWSESSLPRFRESIGRHGAGAFTVAHRDWLTVVDRIYSELRQSTQL